MVVAVPRTLHCSAVRNEMPRPSTTRATPSAAPVVKAGSRAMIPAATATAPNDISTLIASDPVSRLASVLSRSASWAVSLPSSTSRVISRTILMAATSFPRVSCRQLERPLEDAPGPVTRSSKVRGRCAGFWESAIRTPRRLSGATTKTRLRGAGRPSIPRDRDLRPLDRTLRPTSWFQMWPYLSR